MQRRGYLVHRLGARKKTTCFSPGSSENFAAAHPAPGVEVLASCFSSRLLEGAPEDEGPFLQLRRVFVGGYIDFRDRERQGEQREEVAKGGVG